MTKKRGLGCCFLLYKSCLIKYKRSHSKLRLICIHIDLHQTNLNNQSALRLADTIGAESAFASSLINKATNNANHND